MTLGSQGFWTRPGSFIFDPIYKQHDGQKEKCRNRLYEVLFPRSLTIPIGPHAYEKRIKRAFVFHASTSTPSPHYKGVKTRDANLDDYIAGLGLVFSFFLRSNISSFFCYSHVPSGPIYIYIPNDQLNISYGTRFCDRKKNEASGRRCPLRDATSGIVRGASTSATLQGHLRRVLIGDYRGVLAPQVSP